jgi:hypothetical protein
MRIRDNSGMVDVFENFDIVKLELAGCKQGLHRGLESVP